MRTAFLSLVAGLAMVLAASRSEAGSTDSTIVVTNNTNVQLGVIADPTPDILAIINGTTFGSHERSQFIAAGGKFASPGGTATLGVTAGHHTCGAAELTNNVNGTSVSSSSTIGVTTTQGKKTKVTATDTSGTNNALQLTSP